MACQSWLTGYFRSTSRSGNGALGVTLIARAQCVPLGDRRALTLDHPVPVGDLVRSRGLSSHHDTPDQVVLALGVMIPDGHYQAALVKLVSSDVETDRLVKHRIYGVLLDGRLLRLHRLFALE